MATRAFLLTLGLVAGLAALANADEFTLASGEKIQGAVLGETDDVFVVKLADGKTRRIKKSEVIDRSVSPTPRKTSDVSPVASSAVEEMKALAHDAFFLRSHGGSLVSGNPVKTDDGQFVLAPARKDVVETALVFFDKPFEKVIEEAWAARGDTKPARFDILRKTNLGCCWAWAIVEGCERNKGGLVATLQIKSAHFPTNAKLSRIAPTFSLPVEAEPRIDEEVLVLVVLTLNQGCFDAFLDIDDKRERDKRSAMTTGDGGWFDFPFTIQALAVSKRRSR